MCANRDECQLQGRALCSAKLEAPRPVCSDGVADMLRQMMTDRPATPPATARGQG